MVYLSEREGRVVVFGCQHTATKVLEGRNGLPPFEYQEMPCLGTLDSLAVLRALEDGAKGVMVVGCYVGRCRNLTGSQKARMVIGHVGDVLEEVGIPRDRVDMVLGSPLDERGIVSEVERFIAALGGIDE